MPVVLPNVYFDVWRARFSPARGTSVPTPHLSHIEGHLTRIRDSAPVALLSSALWAEYEIRAEWGIDIVKGDLIKNIIRKDTGELWYDTQADETWVVVNSVGSEPPFLMYQDITIKRYIHSGPGEQV